MAKVSMPFMLFLSLVLDFWFIRVKRARRIERSEIQPTNSYLVSWRA